MRNFLKYFIVFMLLAIALWRNDMSTHNVNYNFSQRLIVEMKYIKKDFKNIRRDIVLFKETINFIDNLPTK